MGSDTMVKIPWGQQGHTVVFVSRRSIRSAPVGYAAEYLTLAYVRHNMCRF